MRNRTFLSFLLVVTAALSIFSGAVAEAQCFKAVLFITSGVKKTRPKGTAKLPLVVRCIFQGLVL